MNALISTIGSIVLGYIWIRVYNYAVPEYNDVFLLGSFAAATLHYPTYEAESSARNWFRARAHELKQCACLTFGLIVIALLLLAPDGGLMDITWVVFGQIIAVSVGSVVLVHTIGRLLWRI